MRSTIQLLTVMCVAGRSSSLATNTLDFISGTHDDRIVGNVFTDIGGSGISLGKFTATETTEFHIPYNAPSENEICTSDTIKNHCINCHLRP
jgi:hypothetical protein